MATTKYSFERYLNVRSASGPSFSPDGTRLSFLTDITGVAEVWSIPIDLEARGPAWPEQLTFRGERVSSAIYSPVDQTLLVSADTGGSELNQLYRLCSTGAEFTLLTHRPEVMHVFGGWSADGQSIVFATNERDPRYFDVYERSMRSGERQLLFQHDGTNFPVAYAPDGQHILINRYYSNILTQVLLLDRATGEIRPLTPESANGPASYRDLAWSAESRSLYVLSERDRQFLSLARIDLDAGEMTYLYDENWDAEKLAVTPDGTRMALVFNEDGCSRLELYDIAQGWEERRPLPLPLLPSGVIFELVWSRDGTCLAITFLAASAPPDIWLWHIEQEKLWRATSSALGGIPQESFIEPSVVRYPTFDGRQIPAFLYLPQDMPAQGLPVVISVHGGPEGQARPMFNPVAQYLLAQGYAVLAPNVRGSTGYGYEYQSLDDVRLRMDSVADLRCAALWLRESGIADPQRIVVFGGSYGGFMVLSAITTYPDLWAAAVDIVGIANFVTFLENTHPYRRKLRESEYGSLENDREFLEEISPIRHVDRITTPLIVIHGANDPRVPVGEAEQIVAALRTREVPVEYLRFEDEGHGIIKRANKLIAYPAVVRFLDQCV